MPDSFVKVLWNDVKGKEVQHWPTCRKGLHEKHGDLRQNQRYQLFRSFYLLTKIDFPRQLKKDIVLYQGNDIMGERYVY